MRIIKKVKNKKRIIGFLFLILFVFLSSGFSLKMPFTSQAPEGDWGEPWYNDCEEVSIAMVDSFYNNRVLTKAVAKNEILRIIGLKEKAYGPSLDEDADKMADIINNFLNWKAWVVEDPTIEEIKDRIDSGHPVIALTDGRMLDNRYYTTNEYHVFAISGYDDEKEVFITQDAGTYRGHDYEYSYSIVMDALHDYNSTDVSLGRRVAIFTASKIKEPDKSEVVASPVLSATSSSTPVTIEEIKKDNSLVISPENIEDSGILKTIKGWWIGFVEWIKNIFHRF